MLPWHMPLDLPHIEKAITDSLTFKDLLNGVLINRAWYTALIPLLYADVITFRSNRRHHGIFDHFFDTSDSQRAILKHSHHIRALTCTFPSFSVLMKTGCPNLIELNYVLEFEHSRNAIHSTNPKQGLDVLDMVLAHCPNLRALSLENVSFATDKHTKAVLAFVKCLDRHPGITCFYMSVADDSGGRKLAKPLQDIFEHRLGRINSSKITSLTMMTGRELIRSKRGLPVQPATAASGIPRQYRWAYRGTPLERGQLNLELPRTLSEDEPGRWESECKARIEYPPAIAVLENDGVLELSVPHQLIMDETVSMALFDRFPNLVRFSSGHVRHISTDKVLLLACRNKNLKYLTWNYRNHKQIFDFLRDLPHVELTQLNLRMLPGSCYETLLKPFMFSNPWEKTRYFCNSLVGLMFAIAEPLPLACFLEIVATCPNLQSLQADRVNVPKTNDQGVSPPWACDRLRLLRVYLFSTGSDNWTGELNEQPQEMAQTFMAELGDLSMLEHLELRFVFGEMDVPQTPFLKLALGCKNGLAQLGNLTKLRSLEIHDLAHNIGPKELMWMASRWPELRALTLPKFPVLTQMPFLSLCRGDGRRPTPDFRPWWPNMREQKVRKCNSCQGCGLRQKTVLDSWDDEIGQGSY